MQRSPPRRDDTAYERFSEPTWGESHQHTRDPEPVARAHVHARATEEARMLQTNVGVASPRSGQAEQARTGVLLTEDEVLVRMVAAMDLRDAGFEVIEAGNADEALQILNARADIGALVTDITMPGRRDGADLVRIVRAEFPETRVVVTSGVRANVDADMYFQKPYRREQLVTTLRRLLAVDRATLP
jgi:two-component system, response regulator PdtaR